MASRLNATSCATLALALAAALPALQAQPADGVETVEVAALAPASPYRVYVADVAIPHIVDGKLIVIDTRTMKVEGMVATALAGNAGYAADKSELYVATTYFTRLNRGERNDQLDVYDTTTLKLKAEIPLPPKRAQALPYRGYVRASSDGRWVFVQNATPATSVSVVDLKARAFVTEVPTPGCWALITVPSQPNRFTTVCGDGSLLTVTLDAAGKVAAQKRSNGFFEPDRDPLFIHAEYDGDKAHFVSFQGMVHTANLSGEQATFEPPWPLVRGDDAKKNWRPGGYQPYALHQASGRLFVGMHPGGKEGSHKDPARELWVIDMARKSRIARVPGSMSIALAVTKGDKPLLLGIDGAKNELVSWDAAKVPKPRREKLSPLGDSATLIEVH